MPDQSADAVLCGQAIYWFDLDRALPEMAKALIPGGELAGMWNVDQTGSTGAEVASMSKAGATLSRWRAIP